MPAQYSYEMDGDFSRTKDFDDRVDVIPVSDPNASTMAQRVTQYQSALQLAQQAPQLYDMGKLHRQMLEVLGIQDAEDNKTTRRYSPERPCNGKYGYNETRTCQGVQVSRP